MNLYLIWQTKRTGYDTYDSAVVAATSARSAKFQHPSGDSNNWRSQGTWADFAGDVEAECIGKAVKGTRAGVILASFNAG